MDAQQQQPSPQAVGREFARQYYTLFNSAPCHLHRFYNNNSSFKHGDMALVVGQKKIHECIQQLNFQYSNAKIGQIDSQVTVDNGIVVQVTGELSYYGQPMRRFTQTFVLAAQSSNKYYVHNDIFSYQDLYLDEDSEHVERETSTIIAATVHQTVHQVVNTGVIDVQQLPHSNVSVEVISKGDYILSNVKFDSMRIPFIADQATAPAPFFTDYKAIAEKQEQDKYQMSKQTQTELNPYANIFKKASSLSPSKHLTSNVHQQFLQQQQKLQLQQQQQVSTNFGGYRSNSNSCTSSFSKLETPKSNSFLLNRNNVRNGSNIGLQAAPLLSRDNPARVKKFENCQQLFLGNIPVQATEVELRALFARYGAILEMRILAKPRNPYNYGFITFEEPASVKKCLACCPIYYPENTPGAHKLNVEEKKPRIRQPQSFDNAVLNNNMNNQRKMGGTGGGTQPRSLGNLMNMGLLRSGGVPQIQHTQGSTSRGRGNVGSGGVVKHGGAGDTRAGGDGTGGTITKHP